MAAKRCAGDGGDGQALPRQLGRSANDLGL